MLTDMVGKINGDTYTNNGSVTICYNPNGLFGSGRWKFQSQKDFK